MKERILLVGEDPPLLATRALLLAEWSTEIVNTKESSVAMRTQTFDVVIIGQLVPIAATKELIAESQELNPAPAILAIRFPGEEVDFCVETHTTGMHDHPGWLRE
jgi:hypothetical protein